MVWNVEWGARGERLKNDPVILIGFHDLHVDHQHQGHPNFWGRYVTVKIKRLKSALLAAVADTRVRLFLHMIRFCLPHPVKKRLSVCHMYSINNCNEKWGSIFCYFSLGGWIVFTTFLKDMNLKQTEVVTSAEVVPALGKQATTTKEKISAYFTIAAAAFGLISDGCKSHMGYQQIQRCVQNWRYKNVQDQNNLMTMTNVNGLLLATRYN
jgi:hypothetical protein